MRRLIAQLRPHKLALFFCALCVVLANLAEIAKPAVLAHAIDKYLVGALGAPAGSLLGMGILYFAVAAVGALCTYGQALLVSVICQRVLHTIRSDVFRHIQHMPLEALDRFGTGRLITRATNDVETLAEFYSDVLVNLFRDGVLLLSIVAAMLMMDWRLALISFAALPPILLLTLLVRARLRRNFIEMKRLIGSINAFFAENLAGMRIVQAFNRQKEKLKEFTALNDGYFKTTFVQVTMNSILRPAMEVINGLTIALLIWYACQRILGFEATGAGAALEIGVLYAFTDYIKRFFEPINDLAEKYTTVQSALVSSERIDALLSDPAQEALKDGKHSGAVRGKIEFRHVWFAYEEEDWVLKDVSFTVNPGEKVAFVGATGAGKSTIIQLISRLYAPQRGQILIDGVPICDWRLSDLRRGISVVLQDVFLFAGSIADNVRIAEPMSDAKIRDALHTALADSFVNRLPKGMFTELGERGGTLSQGERQLLSFARAIAHDPAILVLDEATASIDTQTEKRIQQSILRISERRTAIFIAHRLSTITHCDRIYVIHGGEIVESGDHEALLSQNGSYAALLREKAG